MAATGATINLGNLTRKLGGIAAHTDMQRLTFTRSLKESQVYLLSQYKRCFDESRSPDGKPWAPLKRPRNRKRDRKAKGGTGQKPLRDKGLLMAAASASAATGAIRELGRFHLEQGTNLDYAAAQNFGTTIRVPERRRAKAWVFADAANSAAIFTRRIKAHLVRIPARPFIGITQAMVDKIELFVGEDVMRQVGGSFDGP